MAPQNTPPADESLHMQMFDDRHPDLDDRCRDDFQEMHDRLKMRGITISSDDVLHWWGETYHTFELLKDELDVEEDYLPNIDTAFFDMIVQRDVHACLMATSTGHVAQDALEHMRHLLEDVIRRAQLPRDYFQESYNRLKKTGVSIPSEDLLRQGWAKTYDLLQRLIAQHRVAEDDQPHIHDAVFIDMKEELDAHVCLVATLTGQAELDAQCVMRLKIMKLIRRMQAPHRRTRGSRSAGPWQIGTTV